MVTDNAWNRGYYALKTDNGQASFSHRQLLSGKQLRSPPFSPPDARNNPDQRRRRHAPGLKIVKALNSTEKRPTIELNNMALLRMVASIEDHALRTPERLNYDHRSSSHRYIRGLEPIHGGYRLSEDDAG
jgi:hypothetical protein